ncbi:MAG TPA: hypothetical protein VNM90_19950 [Haliangium sp.]|nr:hypothetical protein [Haliangium sp.]
MLTNGIIVRPLALLLLVLDGCVVLDVDDEALVTGSAERAIIAMNGQRPEDLGFASQYMDWLRLNALTTNANAVNRMVKQELSSKVYRAAPGPLQPSPYLIDQLCDPYARQVMKRVVECALEGSTPDAPAQAVTWNHAGLNQPETWYGSIGLCPQWHTGLPSGDCLERVSACVLARLNEQGQTVSISMRGERDAASTLPVAASETLLHDQADGAFFGTLFDPSQIDRIRVEVTSCTGAGAVLAYTDKTRPYSFPLSWLGEAPVPQQRDQIHDQFLLQSGFNRTVYRKAFACWDPYADPAMASQSGRSCTGLVPGQGCAVTSMGSCAGSCVSALDATGVQYDKQCADAGLHQWQWPLDVYYRYDATTEPAVTESAAFASPATLDLAQ